MAEQFSQALLPFLDLLLDWLLYLPSDLAILLIALGTSAILTVLRLWTTDQDLLRRVAEDKRRLQKLSREAKSQGDKPAARRYRDNLALITRASLARSLRGEGLTLLVSIVPIALLATWCFYRLEYHPPRAGDEVRVMLHAPVSATGQVMHLTPQPGLSASSGWVTRAAVPEAIAPESNNPPEAIATWRVKAEASEQHYPLAIRLRNRSLIQPLLVGQLHYSPAVVDHGERYVTEVQMRPVQFLNIVPGVPALALPAWMTAYLLIAILCVTLLKRGLRIY